MSLVICWVCCVVSGGTVVPVLAAWSAPRSMSGFASCFSEASTAFSLVSLPTFSSRSTDLG
jgi:hypothetical protein